jgi:phosphatidylglycerol:prolipoprotein diacylglycerol transferase
MEVAFQLGPLTVRWYSIMILSGIVAGAFLASREAKRRGDNPEHILAILVFAIPLAFIGARLYHVIHRWDFYSQNPILIFAVWRGGLGIFGGLAGGIIGFLIYSKWKRLNILRWLDIIAPSILLGQAIGRWGNFFNQELYGYPTDLPWAVYIDPAHRLPGYENFEHFHPLFLYESLWNFLGCFLLLFLGRKFGHRLLNGEILLMGAIYYSLGRFLNEGLKIDVWTIAGVPTARWICGIAIVVSIAVIAYRRRHLVSHRVGIDNKD